MKNLSFLKEEQFLSAYAQKAVNTKGRLVAEDSCPMRTEFQRDRDRIIYSKAFMRLKNKTQVFFSPEGDHFKTRLTHTLDVSQVSRSIARVLRLNEDLAEAIALGHDLGHTPFGHSGERCLQALAKNGFQHNKQSLRVVDYIENGGKGLNLTFEVRDGILNHRKDGRPQTLEGMIVNLADRISYVSHDIEDAIRARIIEKDDLPKDAVRMLGSSTRERINCMINSIYVESFCKDYVKMEEHISLALDELRDFMFKCVYFNPVAKSEEDNAMRMISALFDYYLSNKECLPDLYQSLLDKWEIETVVCDYLSSMTDRYAVYIFEQLFIPKSFYFRG